MALTIEQWRTLAVQTFIWFFFSVIVALVHFWVGLLINFLLHVPLHLQSLRDGSFLIFSIVLTSASFGDFVRRGKIKEHIVPLLLSVVGCIIILGISVISYVLALNAPLFITAKLDLDSMRSVSIIISVVAVGYGLLLALIVQAQEGNLKWW